MTDNGRRHPCSARHEWVSPVVYSQFRGKPARRLKIIQGEFQQQAKNALIKALTSPPILALPEWDKPFRLHKDASEIGAGAVLAQFYDHLGKGLIYTSRR